jgi:hypothetical protein
MQIHLVGAELFHADGQTHERKLTATFAILRTRQTIQTYNTGVLTNLLTELPGAEFILLI